MQAEGEVRRPLPSGARMASLWPKARIFIARRAYQDVMPKKSGRPKGRYIRGSVDENLSLGTLAGTTGLRQAFGSTVNERTKISSVVASYALEGVTQGDNIGPIMVLLAHGDYSLVEIEAFIEQTTSWNETDLTSQEVGKRKIRRVGIFPAPGEASGPAVLNGGRQVKTKLNWILTQGGSIALVAYNMGSAALATTDPNLHVQGHANLWAQ